MPFPSLFGGKPSPTGQDKPVHVFGFKLSHPLVPTLDMARALWSAPRLTGRDGITDLHGDPSRRLRAMIEETARPRAGGEIKVARCVVVAIHGDSLRADHQVGFEGTLDMLTELARLHREDFRGRVFEEGRGVRWALAEHRGDPRMIVILAGDAVDIPGEGEIPVEDLSLTWIDEDGLETALTPPPWRIPRKAPDGRVVQDAIPVGIVPGQRVLFLGAALGRGAITVPGLTGPDPEGSFFIDLAARQGFEGGCGDGVVLERDGRLTVDPVTGARTWTCGGLRPAKRPGGQSGRLVVSARPRVPRPTAASSAPGDAPRTGTTRSPLPPRPRSDGTAFLDVVGFALPRIDGAATPSGVRDWQLAFAADGALEPDFSRAVARLGAQDRRPDLFWGTSGRFDDRLVVARDGYADVPLGGEVRLRVHNAPVALRGSHHGFLELSHPVPIALPAGPFTIGRGSAETGENRVTFGLLAIPGSLTADNDPTATMERLALSRRHLTAETLDGRRLRVAIAEGAAPAVHIDADGQALARLAFPSPREAVLAEGDGLIIGCYVTRFRSAV